MICNPFFIYRSDDEREVHRDDGENHVIDDIEVRQRIDAIEVHPVIEDETEVRPVVAHDARRVRHVMEPHRDRRVASRERAKNEATKQRKAGANDLHRVIETENEVQVDHVTNTAAPKPIYAALDVI